MLATKRYLVLEVLKFEKQNSQEILQKKIIHIITFNGIRKNFPLKNINKLCRRKKKYSNMLCVYS